MRRVPRDWDVRDRPEIYRGTNATTARQVAAIHRRGGRLDVKTAELCANLTFWTTSPLAALALATQADWPWLLSLLAGLALGVVAAVAMAWLVGKLA